MNLTAGEYLVIGFGIGLTAVVALFVWAITHPLPAEIIKGARM